MREIILQIRNSFCIGQRHKPMHKDKNLVNKKIEFETQQET